MNENEWYQSHSFDCGVPADVNWIFAFIRDSANRENVKTKKKALWKRKSEWAHEQPVLSLMSFVI